MCQRADFHSISDEAWVMGRAEREIISYLRQASGQNETWDSYKIAKALFRSDAESPSNLRQTYRLLDRTRVVPDALTLSDLITRTATDEAESEINETVAHARRRRYQISIVQVKEVRLSQWVVCWNNLRLARNWVWLTNCNDPRTRFFEIVEQIQVNHRLPCCLLFDGSAIDLRDFLLHQSCLMMTPRGDCGLGYYVTGKQEQPK